MSASPILRCGPAGWSSATWNSLIYPRPRPRNFHPLEYLAGCFDTIEINTSFYQPLKPELVRLWVNRVSGNPNFAFTAKLGRRFTHDRVTSAAEVEAFKDGLWPLLNSKRLGCLLMQFPASYRFTAENREHLIALRRAFHEFPLAAEMRHSSWMHDEALGTLIDYRIAFVNIDQPPSLRAMPPTAYLTSPVAYVRLHGRNPAGWLDEFSGRPAAHASNDYLYTRDELQEWKQRIDRIAPLASTTYVITTNDAAARSVVNALQLQALFGDPRRSAPPALIEKYPLALEDFRASRPVQPALFSVLDERAA